MAGESEKRSSASKRSRSEPAGSRRATSPFSLVPLGKHLGKSPIALTRPVIVIGSRESCRIHLNSSSVSQLHALLVLSGGTYYVHDLASRAHVIVSGERFQTRDLKDGDELQIGSFVLKFTGPSAALAADAPAATLQSSDDAKLIKIDKRALLIGRRPGADIMLADGAVSTSHAVIFEMDGQRVVRDLGSRTGTWVNGVQVHQHVLNPGDRLKIGPSSYQYQLSAADAPSAVDSIDSLIDDALSDAGSPAAVVPADTSDADFGLDFLTPDATAKPVQAEPDAAEIPLADALAPEISESSVRRGWRAVVAEPIAEPIAESSPGALPDDMGLDFTTPTPVDDVATGETLPSLDLETESVVDRSSDPTPIDNSATIAPFDLSGLTFQTHSDQTHSDHTHSDTAKSEAVDDSIPLDFALTDAAADVEADKIAAEHAAQEQAEREQVRQRLEAEEAAAKAEAERQRIEADRLATEEADRIEADRLAAGKVERERVESERLAAEEAERQRIEAERLAAEEAARQRVEAERVEAERVAAEEAERQRVEESERQRVEAERVEAERVEAERAERERIEAERLAAEETERQRIEAERFAVEEAERIEAERIAAEEKAAAEKAAAEKTAVEEAERQRVDAERIALENAAAMANERLAAEQREAELAQAAMEEDSIAETIESTEPSPDSALEFELDSLALSADRESDSEHVGEPEIDFDPEQIALAGDTDEAPPVDSISDSAFGRAVEAFSGDLSGSIVESDSVDSSSFAFDPMPTAPSSSLESPESIELSTAGDSASELESPFDELDELADSRPPVAADEIGFSAESSLLENDPGRVVAEPAIDPFDLSNAEASGDDLNNDLNDDRLEPESGSDSSTSTPDIAPAGDATIAPSVEAPAAETVSPPSDVEAFTPAPPAPVSMPQRPPMTPEERGQFWGTAATVLGGMPLVLPEVRPTPLFADSGAVQLPLNTIDEDEHIDSVSQMIGELLDEAVPPSTNLSEVGGAAAEASPLPATPQKRNRRPLTGTAVPPPETSTPSTPSTGESLRIDEQIPPFGTFVSDAKSGRNNRRDPSGRRDEVGATMDSLSRPPVHETDVFSHGSMPSEDLLAPDELSDDPLAPRGRPRALPVAPMDLLGDPSATPTGNGRRPRNGLRGPAAPTIGRINLPNDPFWSGAGNGNGNSGASKPPTANGRRPLNGNGSSNGHAIQSRELSAPELSAPELSAPELSSAELSVADLSAENSAIADPHSADEEIGAAGDASLAEVVDRLEEGKPHRIKAGPNRSSIRRNGQSHGAAKPLVTYAAEIDPNAVHQVRRRRFIRVSALLFGGTVLAVGAFCGCLKFVPVHSQIEARVKYTHLTEAREEAQRGFRTGQAEILRTEGRRIAALHNLPPEVPPGFLGDQAAYTQVVSNVVWPTPQQDVLAIRFDSTEPELDSQRVKAVAQALYDSNGILLDDANRNRDRLADATEQLNNLLRQTADLQKAIEQNRAIADAWPPVEKMAALTANADKLNKAWKDAEVAQKNAQAEIEQLKLPAGVPDASIPAGAAAAAGSTADANVGQMQGDLDALQAKIAKAKDAHDQQAVQARGELDAALSQFQQQVTAARELSKDNPELLNYASAAQRLQETTRKLVDDHIRRQQQSYTRITNLQATLGEKMQAKREQMWQDDDKLKDLNNQLEYAKRAYNTAIGTGQQKEAADYKAQIDLMENMIKARQDTMPDDPIYSSAVDGLQKMVEQQKQEMKEDREQSDELLNTLQKSFADSQPAIDKLPAQQKTLAADMEKRLADINAARAKFNDVASAATADDATRKLQDQASQLNASIAARKKQLADQSVAAQSDAALAKRKADLEARESELPKLTQAVTDSKNAYWAADAELQDAKRAVELAKVATDKGTDLTNQKIRLNAQLEQVRSDVDQRQDDVRTSIEPVQVADSDIQKQLGVDNRALYGSISSASILLVAGLLILMTIHAANQELPLNAMDPSDDAVDPFWQSSAAVVANDELTSGPVEPFPGANEAVANDGVVDPDLNGTPDEEPAVL